MIEKNQAQDSSTDPRIILGMILLPDRRSFSVDAFFKDFARYHPGASEQFSGDNQSLVFAVGEETIIIGYVDVPVPESDIEGAARYAYNWPTAADELKNHQSHLIVSVMNGTQDQINRFMLFTQVNCSVLNVSDALGVYQGNQSLLTSKKEYLLAAAQMSADELPLNIWIYFGLRITDNGHSGYTYGLSTFNKTEMEIVDSVHGLQDIAALLFDVAHYVLVNDVEFRDGQTLGSSPGEKIGIQYSKGKFVNGYTFKLLY